MSFLHFNLSGFGLDISDTSLKLAYVAPGRNHQRYLHAWSKVEIPKGIIEDGVIIKHDELVRYIKQLLQRVNGKLATPFAVAGLPESKTFLKVLKIEKREGDSEGGEQSNTIALIRALEEELPKEIPLPVENISYDYTVLEENSSWWQVLVGAAPQDIINDYTRVIKSAGITLLALEIEAQAIVRALVPEVYTLSSRKLRTRGVYTSKRLPAFKKNVAKNKILLAVRSAHNDEQHIIVDIGAIRSSMVIFHNNAIRLTRSLELSGNSITRQIATALNLSLAKAEQAKIICGLDPKKCKGEVLPIMELWLAKLIAEITETYEYYTRQAPFEKQSTTHVVMCGGSAALAGLEQTLTERIGMPVTVISELTKIPLALAKEVPTLERHAVPGFVTAIGLAMRSL